MPGPVFPKPAPEPTEWRARVEVMFARWAISLRENHAQRQIGGLIALRLLRRLLERQGTL